MQRPRPEEVVNSGGNARGIEAPRNDFEDGVWFKLSVGRKQRAEPRWILPLICKAGGVTKRDIGAIRIFETESRFELSAESAERFSQALARSGGREDSITITRVNGRPEQLAGREETLTDGAKQWMRKTPGLQRKKRGKISSSAQKNNRH
jgi:ATP-dependent RNA helicase DeaD